MPRSKMNPLRFQLRAKMNKKYGLDLEIPETWVYRPWADVGKYSQSLK